MTDSTTTLLLLAAVIAVFVWNRLPVGLVALGTTIALWATGLLTIDEAMSGFGDPVVVFIATLFVVSEGIDATGLTTWAGSRLVRLAGETPKRLVIAVMLLSAALTALISLNGSVAALLPMVVAVSLRLGRQPSRLLMPMAYAGSAGSLLVLTGSPVNIVVSDAADNEGIGAFSFFEFAWVGVPILVVTVVVSLTLAPRLLPSRTAASKLADHSRHGELMASYYELSDGFYRLRVRQRSPLIGLPVDEIDLDRYPEIRILGMQASDAGSSTTSAGSLTEDDVLVVTGPSDEISKFAVELVLAVAMRPLSENEPQRLVNREVGVVEAVIPPRSPLVGATMFPGMVREHELVILAISHHNRDCGPGPVEIQVGDALLIYGTWDAVDRLVDDRDVVLVDSPDAIRRQVELGPRAGYAAAALIGMVVLLAFDLVPPAIAGVLAAGAMVLTNTVSSQQAYRAVSWEAVILIGGLIPLAAAVRTSGAGDRIADALLTVVGSDRPILLMVALFVVTVILGVALSNTATALIMVPIGVAAAAESAVALEPILMLIAVASSAALLTPIQTPGNLMIMAPGGYRFGDYARLGVPVLIGWLAVALIVIPVVWPLDVGR